MLLKDIKVINPIHIIITWFSLISITENKLIDISASYL